MSAIELVGWIATFLHTIYILPEFITIFKTKKLHFNKWTIWILTLGNICRAAYVMIAVPDTIIRFGIILMLIESIFLWYYIIFPGGIRTWTKKKLQR